MGSDRMPVGIQENTSVEVPTIPRACFESHMSAIGSTLLGAESWSVSPCDPAAQHAVQVATNSTSPQTMNLVQFSNSI